MDGLDLVRAVHPIVRRVEDQEFVVGMGEDLQAKVQARASINNFITGGPSQLIIGWTSR